MNFCIFFILHSNSLRLFNLLCEMIIKNVRGVIVKLNSFTVFLFLISFNVFAHEFAITSNYVWRGQTQSNDQPAVQAEVSKALWNGGEASLWASSINESGQELDATLSQAISFDDGSLSLGGIFYHYNRIPSADYLELFLSLEFKNISFEYYHGIDSSYSSYTNIGYSYDINELSSLGLSLGHSDFRSSTNLESYIDLQLSYTHQVSKIQSVSLGWTNTWRNVDEDNLVFTSSWSF